jgi:hypothetical protein
MAKSSGLGDNYYVGGYDLSGDTQDFPEIAGGFAPLPSTDITQLAVAREIGGKRDGRLSWVSFFNKATSRAHPVLSALPTADRIASYYRGTALGGPAFCLNGKQINYDGSRGEDGGFMFAVNVQGNGYGGEWGVSLTAGKRTDTAATNGTGVDFAAASSFGLQAYLQVFAFAGTDATVKLQESSDNGAGDAWADVTGGGFTQITSTTPQSQRIETTRNLAVERYLRVVTTTSAGFTSLTFAVVVAKNATETLF